MKKIIKKAILLLLTCLLFGCSHNGEYRIKEESKDEKQVAMGRYLEESTKIDELIEPNEDVTLWQTEDEKIEVIKCGDQFENYEYKEDGTCKESEEWLTNILNNKENHIGYVNQIITGNEAGTYYMLGERDGGNDLGYFIAKISETSFEEIPIEWESDAQIVLGMAITSDNNLVVCDATQRNTKIFNLEGKCVMQIGDEALKPAIVGDKLVCMGTNKIEIYNEKTFELEKTIENITCNPRQDSIYGYKGESAYIVIGNGVYKINKGTEVLEKIIEGNLSSIDSCYHGDLLVHNEEIYISLSKYDKAMNRVACVKKYTYHSDIPSVPEQEVVIWTPTSSRILKDAIGIYRERHPEVYVKMEVLYNEEEWWENEYKILSDDMEALNTQILAGEGPDLFVLDNLPIESYRKSNILADLSNCIAKNKEENHYLDSILESCKDDEKIYAVPLGFSLSYALGKKDLLEGGYSLEKIADYQKNHPDEMVLAPILSSTRVQLNAEYMKDQLFTSDGRVNKEKMKAYLEMVKAVKCTQIKYPPNAMTWKTWNDVSQYAFNDFMKVDIERAASLDDLQCSAYAVHELPDYTLSNKIEGIESMLQGQQIIGINQNSKNKEAAEEIISIALSTEIQGDGGGSGLPVNLDALEESLLHNNHREMNKIMCVKCKNGEDGYLDQDFDSFEYGYLEEMNQFLEWCKTGKVIKPIDREIDDILEKETEAYFNDNASLDETVNKVESMINLHLSEQGK